MSGKKILMLVGEFTEEYEIFVFQQAMEAVMTNQASVDDALKAFASTVKSAVGGDKTTGS